MIITCKVRAIGKLAAVIIISILASAGCLALSAPVQVKSTLDCTFDAYKMPIVRGTITSVASRVGLKNIRVSQGLPPLDVQPVNYLVGAKLSRTTYTCVMADKFITATSGDQLFGNLVNGIIGGDLMAAAATLIDFDNRRITLLSPGFLSPEEVAKLGMADATVLPLVVNNNQFSVPARVVGIDQLFLIDTGCDISAISHDVAKRLKLRSVPLGYSTTAIGLIPEDIATIKRLSLGSIQFTNMPVKFHQSSMEGFASSILGMDILLQCKVIIDVPAHKLYIKRIPAKNDPEADEHQ